MIQVIVQRVETLAKMIQCWVRRTLPSSLVIGAIACFLAACLGSAGQAGQAQSATCPTSSQWVAAYSGRQINYPHIFCGELRDGQLSGFHSRPNGQNPSTVGQFTITQSANAQGIYAGQWSYAGSSSPSKFSTMFPDPCLATQVLNSIAYAEAHRVTCPAGAPSWAWCGQNRPTSGSDNSSQFCPARDGTTFIIAGANLSDGRINTGFPLRQ
ncbi:MAG TPA: EndoU domain-containing protein [Candidatus Obscuribacterales bacterium]